MREILQLVLPVVLTYLGFTLMGIVDLIYVGKLNAAAIGAVGLGNSLFSWFLVFGLGLTSSLEYLVSHAHGANDHDRKHHYLSQGIWISIGLSVPVTFILILISSNLARFGVNDEVLEPAKNFSIVLSFSILPAYLFNVIRLYLTSMGIARPAMVMLILGNILNIIADSALVVGNWGVPSFGAVGAAWATLLSRTLMVLGLGAYLIWWDKKNGNRIQRLKIKYHFQHMRELIRVGLPAALQMSFEVGVFALSTGLASRLTANQLAAHQIILNTVSTTFMVPLGVGSATSVLVGNSLGRKEIKNAVRMGWQGFQLGAAFMAISSIVLLLFSDQILRFFTTDIDIITVGKSIFFIAALFQLSDGAQTVGTGALRGLGDTHSAMILNLLGHWVLGLPVGVLLCFKYGWGLQGLWVGLSLGLTFVAIGVLYLWWKKTRSLAM